MKGGAALLARLRRRRHRYSRLVFATAIGVVVFAELPSPRTGLGSAVIVASTLYIVHRERVRRAVTPRLEE